MSQSERIKIGAWTVSPALNLLESGAQSITIEPRAMDVLMALAGRPGAVVSIEELMASVWKGVVVGEGSVYFTIRQLRLALDGSREGASYIETIPKRGYRLTVPVTPFEAAEPATLSPPSSSPSPAAPLTSSDRVPRRFRWRLAACVAVAAVTFAVLALILRRDTPSALEHSVAVLPFKNLSADAEQEYFADGITAELLSTLSRIRGLVSPEHAEEWRRKGADALEQARALTPDAPHVLLETGIRAARSGHWLEANEVYARLTDSYARYGMANQAWGPRGVFLLSVGRVREATEALERARAQEPLAPAIAGFLSDAKLAAGDLDGAFTEIDRGLKLEGLHAWLVGMGVIAALTQGDRAGIEARLAAMADGFPGVPLNRRVSQFLDAPAGVEAEIRTLAASATDSETALLARWAAYYGKPELALELLTQATPHLALPSVLWQPLMRDVRRLPGFKDLVRRLGLVDYWRAHGWSDFCRPLDREDFACG